MKDRQKIYLDKIVKLLVTDTIIDYDKEKISYPFFHSSSFDPPPSFPLAFLFLHHCKNQFGLTDEEIDYVWNEFKLIIKDKIKNNGR